MDYQYTSTAGYNVNVPASIHKIIQRGHDIAHVNGGKLTKTCKFIVADGKVKIAAKVDATIEAAKANKVSKPAKVATVKVTKTPGVKSKADLMREFVAKAKKEDKTLEDAIAYGINDLGQNKHQAKKYASDIWNQTK